MFCTIIKNNLSPKNKQIFWSMTWYLKHLQMRILKKNEILNNGGLYTSNLFFFLTNREQTTYKTILRSSPKNISSAAVAVQLINYTTSNIRCKFTTLGIQRCKQIERIHIF